VVNSYIVQNDLGWLYEAGNFAHLVQGHRWWYVKGDYLNWVYIGGKTGHDCGPI